MSWDDTLMLDGILKHLLIIIKRWVCDNKNCRANNEMMIDIRLDAPPCTL